MKIEIPTVGPLVGHTTADQARIWLRGELQPTPDGHRRAFGVARWKSKGAAKFGDPVFVPLMPHFDMTGVCVCRGLKPSTTYDYQAGWFFAETELPNLDKTQDLDWKHITTISFTTGTQDPVASRAYAIGSCRYLLRFAGGVFWDERGDKVFRSMIELIAKGERINAVIMMGDQIYADDLSIAFPTRTIDDFLKLYRLVFSQPNFQALTSQVPTYMVLDDHEIEDNWPSKATDKDRVTLYPAAIHSYQIYQCSHSPLFEVGTDGRLTGTLTKFWYTFQDGCCDWFVMDTRNERKWSDVASERRMINNTQMNALLGWLNDKSGRVKVVVSSVPFIPDMESESEDKWGGFLPQRTQILDHILRNQIRKTVFLSGDVHCSFSVELTSPADPSFKVIQVISSSFFWPYPHMDESGFILKGRLKSTSLPLYDVNAASKVYSEDNFSRIEIDPNGIGISFFTRKGDRLGKVRHRSF